MQAGFIGLGTLGRAMAERLIAQGVALTVWNRTAAKAQGLDAVVAQTPAEVLDREAIVFLNLRDSDAVADVLASDNGLLHGDIQDKLIIDTTTNHFSRVVGFHEQVAAAGGTYLEVPVAGSVVPASTGALTILASGDPAAYERALPLLKLLGSTQFFLETPGFATRMKLINNVVLGTFMATLAEAVALGEAAGLDRAQVIEILLAGGGNSGVLRAKEGRLRDLDFANHFSGAMIHKDLYYAGDLARALERPLFTGGLTRDLFAMMFLKGIADEDFSAIYKIFTQD